MSGELRQTKPEHAGSETALELVAKAQTILDVGCNVGNCAEPLRPILPQTRMIGLDCVPERVAEARMVLEEAHEGFANDLPFSDGSLCAVIARND